MLWRNDEPGRFAAHLPGFLVTTALKAGDLALSHPRALVRGTAGLRLGRRPAGRGVHVETEPFDYRSWVRSHL